MTISATLRALALAALVVAATPALADHAGSGSRDPTTDNSGQIALSMNITNAGNTPQTIGAFFDALPKARQRSLVYGCRSIREAPAYANREVLSFCGILVEITRKVPPAPPPPHWGS